MLNLNTFVMTKKYNLKGCCLVTI